MNQSPSPMGRDRLPPSGERVVERDLATGWKETRHPGVAIRFLRTDAETGDVTALIRMAPGCSYPPHRHNGVEEIYVVQGGYRDKWGEHLAGQYVCNPAGSAHHPIAISGQDCVLFAVARGGVTDLEKEGE